MRLISKCANLIFFRPTFLEGTMTQKYIRVVLAAVALLGANLCGYAALAADAPPHLDTSGVNMQPAYPASAAGLNESGSVVIGAYVRDNGTVEKVALRQSSGYPDLDNAAANAVMHWKFMPAMSGGSPTSDWANVQIQFTAPRGAQ
jgi:TonB family protein